MPRNVVISFPKRAAVDAAAGSGGMAGAGSRLHGVTMVWPRGAHNGGTGAAQATLMSKADASPHIDMSKSGSVMYCCCSVTLVAPELRLMVLIKNNSFRRSLTFPLALEIISVVTFRSFGKYLFMNG